jgi:hypothetical protein
MKPTNQDETLMKKTAPTLTFAQIVQLKSIAMQLELDPQGRKITPDAWGVIFQTLPSLLESYEQRERMKGLLLRARDFTKRKWQEGSGVQVSQVTTAFIKAVETELS